MHLNAAAYSGQISTQHMVVKMWPCWPAPQLLAQCANYAQQLVIKDGALAASPPGSSTRAFGCVRATVPGARATHGSSRKAAVKQSQDAPVFQSGMLQQLSRSCAGLGGVSLAGLAAESTYHIEEEEILAVS